MKKLLLLLLVACDDATMLVVDNGYSNATKVDRVWWSETLVPDVVAAGAESPAYRTVVGEDFAYAVIDRGGGFIPVRTSARFASERGSTLHILVSPSTVIGDCASGTVLTQGEADVITQSIFPAEFAGVTYDAATCTTTK
jgi:hypothetical protein